MAGSQDETQCRIVAGAPAQVPGVQVRLLGARLMHGNFERVGGGREHADVSALESGGAAVRHGRDHGEGGARRQRRFDLGHQIGHLATAPVEERRPLRIAHHVGEPPRCRHARGDNRGVAVALEQLTRLCLQPVGVDASRLGGVTRGGREAQGKQRPRPAIERRRGELRVVAPVAGQPARRLQNHCGEVVAMRQIGAEIHHVVAHRRVRRAEPVRVELAKRVAGHVIGMGHVQPRVEAACHPGRPAEVGRGPLQLGEGVAFARHGMDLWLDVAVALRPGPEVDRPGRGGRRPGAGWHRGTASGQRAGWRRA